MTYKMVTADAQVRADGWFTGVLAAPADMGNKKKERSSYSISTGQMEMSLLVKACRLMDTLG